MKSSAFRRIGAFVGAAVVINTISTTTPATAKVEEGSKDRPCFMIRSSWNNGEGPQPTCPNGVFKRASVKKADAAKPTRSGRIVDFMS